MWVAFALQKLLTFFQQKISAYMRITRCKFNESLTNDIVSFEQPGPGDQIFSLTFRNLTSLFLNFHLWSKTATLKLNNT